MFKAAGEVAAKQAQTRLTGAATSIHGVFAVNKPPGISCAGVLDYLKRSIVRGTESMPFSEHFERERSLRSATPVHKKKSRRKFLISSIRAGHGGTLDVEAGGVLVVGINGGCKMLSEYLIGGKSYLATGRLGVATESFDAEGRVTRVCSVDSATGSTIQQAIPRFIGDIMQRPPVFSAIKIDGKRLYEYAREGEHPPVEIKARRVSVADIRLLYYENHEAGEKFGRQVLLPPAFARYYAEGIYAWNSDLGALTDAAIGQPLRGWANQPQAPNFQLLISSGGGVYVRSLIHDLGETVGSAATMISLVRMSQGPLRLG
ncbi:pseudouridine synthase pus4, partial [Coemansia sp. RSA 2322]